MTKDEQIKDAQAKAEAIRETAPMLAAQIDAAIDELIGGERQTLTVEIVEHLRVEKFDGDWTPGMEPVEVVETRNVF